MEAALELIRDTQRPEVRPWAFLLASNASVKAYITTLGSNMATPLIAIAIAGFISPHPLAGDPLCYFDRADGSREDLSGLCGDGPISSPVTAAPPSSGDSSERPWVDEYQAIEVGSSTFNRVRETLGGNWVRRGTFNRGRSTEFAHEWVSPTGNRLGVLSIGGTGTITAKVWKSGYSDSYQLEDAGVSSEGDRNSMPCIFGWQLNETGTGLCSNR